MELDNLQFDVQRLQNQVQNLQTKIEWLKSVLFDQGSRNAALRLKGNLLILDNERPPSSPLKFFMGETEDRGAYMFAQHRFDGQTKGLPFWAGWETFERVNPENPANGYGFHPLRIWGSNVLFEADGVSVTRESVTSRIYFQSPLHRDPESGKFISPHHYDEQGTPWADAEETRQLGGIMWNKDNLNSCLTVDGEGMLTFIWNGESYQLLTTKKD
jgi:hypothetical protein